MRALAAALLLLVAQAASAQAPSLYGMPFSSDPTCSAGTYWLAVNTTVGGWRICFNGTLSTMGSGGGSGEVNTHSSVGGGLALTAATPKVGVDLRLVSLASADFDSSADLVTIDATKWITIAAANAAYQPIDSDLTDLADGVLTGSKVQAFGAANAGAVPLSGGGTTNFLRADGSWAAPPGGAPGGSTTQVQFNNAGAFGGSALLTWNGTTLTVGDATTQGFLDVKCPTPGSMECATTYVEDTAATSPAAGSRKLQARSSGFYERDSAGVERQFVMGTMAEGAAPATPPAGFVALYAKNSATAEFCSKDDAGVETCMSAGSGGGGGATYADVVAAVLAGF